MKRTFPLLATLAVTGIASADTTVKLAPLDAPVALPDNALQQKLKLDNHEVRVLREQSTAGVPGRTQLAFAAKPGEWRLYWSVPGYSVMTLGKLKGGRVAMIHRVDKYDGSKASHVDICAYAKDGGGVSCGAVEVECPETGCQEPTIVKGALWLHAKGGRKRFPIE